MARPYSNDLRDRVAAAVLSGRSCREVAGIFGVSVASVVKWTRRHRETGTAAARRMGGNRKRILEPYRALVLERLTADPDLTIPGLAAQLAAEGIEANRITLWRLVRSSGMTVKKNAVRQRAGSSADRVGGGHSGRNIRAGLILRVWSSSTRPG